MSSSSCIEVTVFLKTHCWKKTECSGSFFGEVNYNECMVFNPDDIMDLHTKYRMIGKCIGSVPFHSQQQIFQTSPMIISPECVTYGLQKGFLKLKISKTPLTPSSSSSPSSSMISLKATTTTTISSSSSSNVPKTSGSLSTLNEIPSFEKSGEENRDMYIDVTQERDRMIWKFPVTEDEQQKYMVYKDLHEKGYYITHGEKFGVDYLIYEKDPLLYHSFAMVKVVEYKKGELSARMIIEFNRIANSSKKQLILASTINKQVHYLSFKWRRTEIRA